MPAEGHSVEAFRELVEHARRSAYRALATAGEYARQQGHLLSAGHPRRDDSNICREWMLMYERMHELEWRFAESCREVLAVLEHIGETAEERDADVQAGAGHWVCDVDGLQTTFYGSWEIFTEGLDALIRNFKEVLVCEHVRDAMPAFDREVDRACGLSAGDVDMSFANALNPEDLPQYFSTVADTHARHVEEARAAAWAVVDAVPCVWEYLADARMEPLRTAHRT
ncbi:hypothetical protein [Streptomyces sp. WAC06614]|uniref:hypothetical protein n=1 Tax=Streptomyces sp. WAC06614 TaxID=2487416 RepID=UPI000F76A52B|nr:hypothetical protein [Streptomyces sp. WAC06614]RSS79746.1 hypothetical protein EF918_16100 [Streptomyces sp. WAC06614]